MTSFLDRPFSSQTWWQWCKTTVVTNNINDWPALSKCPSKSWQCDSEPLSTIPVTIMNFSIYFLFFRLCTSPSLLSNLKGAICELWLEFLLHLIHWRISQFHFVFPMSASCAFCQWLFILSPEENVNKDHDCFFQPILHQRRLCTHISSRHSVIKVRFFSQTNQE